MMILVASRNLPRRKPLAVSLAAIFAASLPATALADEWTVDNCGDDGGTAITLRYALANATSPALIHLGGLSCVDSKITLSGPLSFSLDTVTLDGGTAGLTIAAPGGTAPDNRVLVQYGTGTLTVQGLTIAGGYSFAASLRIGGCIYSGGDVVLTDSDVSSCTLVSYTTHEARGGAIYAYGSVTLTNSHVHGATARANSNFATGGGIFARGSVTLEDNSIVYDNRATSATYFALGGGIYAGAGITLTSSTVSGNSASESAMSTALVKGGGLYSKAGTVSLTSSIVSNNRASSPNRPVWGGGIYAAGSVTLDANSHVYGNSATAADSSAYGGGIFAVTGITLTSSTVSGNRAANASTTLGLAEGGGLYSPSGDISLTSSVVSSNVVSAPHRPVAGGGIFAGGNVTLTDNSSVSDGLAFTGDAALGGGIYGGGSVTLTGSQVTGTTVTAAGSAKGGGVYCKGTLTLTRSIVAGNLLNGAMSFGGGVFSSGNSSVAYSSITYNTAGGSGYGAGLNLKGTNNTIMSSTISNNTSGYEVGGVLVAAQGSGGTFTLENSTISNNYAPIVGGLGATSASVSLLNSTIAFNTAGGGSGSPAGGAVLVDTFNYVAVTVESMLISNNYVGSTPSDLGALDQTNGVAFNGGDVDTPANNLIRATAIMTLPTDTSHACPRLGRLRDNGGLTFTHALLSGSPAIDAGNSGFLGVAFDQRGSAAVNGTLDYTRFSGPGMLTDIGAYEVQQDDIVFDTDFEDCAPLAL